jgi:hypothetical protein
MTVEKSLASSALRIASYLQRVVAERQTSAQ